jgi:H+/Na+-translocating ferredoxin:NAD+ oxidoreductase subunit B
MCYGTIQLKKLPFQLEVPVSEALYRSLREHLDRMPIAFPQSPSGIELRILKRFFSIEEAEIALALSMLPETSWRIFRRYRRAGGSLSPGDVEARLKGLARRGAINGGIVRKRGKLRRVYGKLPFAVGLYEFQVDRLTREFEEEASSYMDEAFMEHFTAEDPRQMRTIPINETILPDRNVSRYDNIRAVIENSAGPFALQNCICRQGRELVGGECSQTELKDTCLALGSAARGVLAEGRGRELSREETLLFLRRAESEGLVLQGQNTRDPLFVCCCCSCCCAILSRVKKLPDPGRVMRSNYTAGVDSTACIGCGACLKRCPMDAIRLERGGAAKNGMRAVIAEERCIGCGLCLGSCSPGAISLKARGPRRDPPGSAMMMYIRMLYGRFGFLRSTGLLIRAGLGFKV